MSILHQQLALSDLTPGMVLSHSLLDTQGQVLLPKGAVLTEKTIESLRRHNIASVNVVTGELTPEEDALRARQAQARLKHLFRNTEENPINHLLHQYVSNFRSGECE